MDLKFDIMRYVQESDSYVMTKVGGEGGLTNIVDDGDFYTVEYQRGDSSVAKCTVNKAALELWVLRRDEAEVIAQGVRFQEDK